MAPAPCGRTQSTPRYIGRSECHEPCLEAHAWVLSAFFAADPWTADRASDADRPPDDPVAQLDTAQAIRRPRRPRYRDRDRPRNRGERLASPVRPAGSAARAAPLPRPQCHGGRSGRLRRGRPRRHRSGVGNPPVSGPRQDLPGPALRGSVTIRQDGEGWHRGQANWAYAAFRSTPPSIASEGRLVRHIRQAD